MLHGNLERGYVTSCVVTNKSSFWLRLSAEKRRVLWGLEWNGVQNCAKQEKAYQCRAVCHATGT